MTCTEERLITELEWTLAQLRKFVSEDNGNGAFIRGTGTELVGFGIRVHAIEDLVHEVKRGQAR